jgi:hypothetical protein
MQRPQSHFLQKYTVFFVFFFLSDTRGSDALSLFPANVLNVSLQGGFVDFQKNMVVLLA